MTNKANNNDNAAEINVNGELLVQQSGTPVNDNLTSKNRTLGIDKISKFCTKEPVEFWKKWSCMNNECFNENGRQGNICHCFEGIGSVM